MSSTDFASYRTDDVEKSLSSLSDYGKMHEQTQKSSPERRAGGNFYMCLYVLPTVPSPRRVIWHSPQCGAELKGVCSLQASSLRELAVFQITFKVRELMKNFEGVNRCGSLQSLPFGLLGQQASFVGFFDLTPLPYLEHLLARRLGLCNVPFHFSCGVLSPTLCLV